MEDTDLVQYEHTDGRLVVRLESSRLDKVRDDNQPWETIPDVFKSSGSRILCLDFQNVEFLSSAILGKVVTLHRKTKAADGNMYLFNLHERVHEMFRITGLIHALSIIDSLNEVEKVD